MHRFVRFLCLAMAVLLVWTTAPALAQSSISCVPTVDAAAEHFGGDGDEVPCQQSLGTHHHADCGGHQLTPIEPRGPAVASALSETPSFTPERFWLAGLSPGEQLRPPRA